MNERFIDVSHEALIRRLAPLARCADEDRWITPPPAESRKQLEMVGRSNRIPTCFIACTTVQAQEWRERISLNSSAGTRLSWIKAVR